MVHSKFSSILLLAAPITVWGHGYMQSPRSRNYVAYKDGLWWGGDASTPAPESCPHCLNIGGTESMCGITGSTDYNFPKNVEDQLLGPSIQATYEQGQEIDLEVVLSAHHKGHFSYKACPISPGEVPTQECFDMYPLEFVQDHFYNAPKDENYPSRAYIPLSTFPGLKYESGGVYGSHYKYRYKLPDTLVGDLVLIQWYYLTANSCRHPGYDEYPFPDGFADSTNLDQCESVPPDGRGVPEQFWNCAEVTITPSGPIQPTVPVTMSPAQQALPTYFPSLSPVAAPIPGGPLPTANYCGQSWFDAKDLCGTPCPTGNSTVCPPMLHCYADVPCAANDTPTNDPTRSPVTDPSLPSIYINNIGIKPKSKKKGTQWDATIKVVLKDEGNNKVEGAVLTLKTIPSVGQSRNKDCKSDSNGLCVIKTPRYDTDGDDAVASASIKFIKVVEGEGNGKYDANLNKKNDAECPILSPECESISFNKP